MPVQYQVVGSCAHATVDGPHSRRRQLHFKGTLLPSDVPQVEIQHLLSVGLIAPIGVGVQVSAVPEEPENDGPSADQPSSPAEVGEPAEGDSGGDNLPADRDAEAGQKWAEAIAKAEALVAAGSKPDGRSAPLTVAAFLVLKGYDRAAVEKADKPDLLNLVNSLDQ